MANRDLTETEKSALESLVDATNVQAVLMALSEICDEKADHIRASYNDAVTAKAWASACGAIGCMVSDKHIVAVSA